ncbi:putative toxin-antitoxin system toxin component, PIN family [Candidatus Pacearchaeota archaeon]|nr:putative toxin-antitoxin system toxin component, PIN family [Candidatus Pacearchaeota archaeon]
MRITPDTNVLVSSIFWRGVSFKILEMAVREKIEIVLSEEIIGEFINVLNSEEIVDKVKEKKLELNYAINEIAAFAEIVYPSEKLNVVEEDADDNKILECAVEGEVDYIVTNGKHLLKIGEFRGIRILTPKNFIEKISNF